MAANRAGQAATPPIWVRRRALLDQCRRAADAEQDIHLTGESGVGKTALAKRIRDDAIYLAHPSPAGELLCALLFECYRRGAWEPDGAEDETLDEIAIGKAVRKLGQKAAVKKAVEALEALARDEGKQALIVLDDFDAAPAAVVRIVGQLAGRAVIVAVSGAARPHQKRFLFGCTGVKVPRFTAAQSAELVEKLLQPHSVSSRDRAGITRFLIEQSQGVPAVMIELVRRAVKKGELSLRVLRGEGEAELDGHRQIDMTPGLVVFACGLVALRVMSRGMGDQDITVLLGASGALFMLVRFYAGRLSRRR